MHIKKNVVTFDFVISLDHFDESILHALLPLDWRHL